MSDEVCTPAPVIINLWEPLPKPSWAEGFLYLLETSERFQKIGYSADPRDRVLQFQSLPFCVWLGHYFPVSTRRFEKVVQKSLVHKRLRGEWFVLTPPEIAIFKAVQELRSEADLPSAFRPLVRRPLKLPHPRMNDKRSGRKPKAWYRKSRDRWYVWFAGVQYPLTIRGADNGTAAATAGRELVSRLCGMLPPAADASGGVL